MTDVTLTLLAPTEPQAALIAKDAVAAGLAIIADDLRAPALMRAPTLPLVGIPSGPPGPPGPAGGTPDVEFALEMAPPGTTPSVTRSGSVGRPLFTIHLPTTRATVAEIRIPIDASTSVWTISHGLERYPNVQVMNSAGSVVFADVRHLDTATVEVSFAYATGGYIIIS